MSLKDSNIVKELNPHYVSPYQFCTQFKHMANSEKCVHKKT